MEHLNDHNDHSYQWQCESIGELFLSHAKNWSASSHCSLSCSRHQHHGWTQKSEELWALQQTGQRLRDLIRTLNSIMRFPKDWWRRCHSNDTWWNMEEITWTVAIPFWRCSRRGIMSLSSFFHSRTTPTEAKRGGVNIEKIHTISDPWQPCGAPSTIHATCLEFHLSSRCLDYPFVSPQKTPRITDVKVSPWNGSVL